MPEEIAIARVLITGMSGAGKSTLLAAIASRGYHTVDTDYDGWEVAGARWDEPRMHALLADHHTIAVCGTAENQGRFYDRFEHVIYLYVPLDTLLERVRTRCGNPYGKTAEQQADITRYVIEVEPRIRRSATLELNGLTSVAELADRVEQCLVATGTSHEGDDGQDEQHRHEQAHRQHRLVTGQAGQRGRQRSLKPSSFCSTTDDPPM